MRILTTILAFIAISAHATTQTFSGSIAGPTITTSGTAANPLVLDFSQATLTSTLTLNGVAFVTVQGGTAASGVKNACITFNGQQSHDVIINGFTYTGPSGGTTDFISASYCYNLTVENCHADNVMHFVFGDSILNHDITILNNYARTSNNTVDQTDVIFFGDAYNVTIQGNKLINQAPGDGPSGRHNDIIQCYMKGGGNAGNPKNWIVRYNWIEMQQNSGSGDNSWTMLENMDGNPAMKLYGNVFVGTGSVGNNGTAFDSNNSTAVFYCYNNTYIRHNAPDNTIRFLSPGNVNFRNNVMEADPSTNGTYVDNTMRAASTWDYNFFFNANPNQSNSGSHGSTSVNPMFTNYAGNDFSLAPGSPLIGKGDPSIGAEYNTGIAKGATWPNPTLVARSSWDVGAFQSSVSPSQVQDFRQVSSQ